MNLFYNGTPESRLYPMICLIITHSMPFNEQFTVIVRPSLNDTFDNSYGTPFNDCG